MDLKRHNTWVFGLLMLFAPLFGAAQSRAESIIGRIDARMQIAEEEDGFSGVVFVGKGDQILLNKGYGWADPVTGLKNNGQKRFMIASISKSFVAACILQLEEQGLLKLHDPIGKYLPDYPEWAAQNITIHHLLTHTSGIPDYINDFPLKFKLKQLSGWEPSKDELIESFEERPLGFYPGERFKYSNSGYVLLARIVERVSGTDFGIYLQRNILRPLGMENTGIEDFDYVNNRAHAFKGKGRKKKVIQNFKNEWIFGMGEMYSTSEDLSKWLNSFNDTLILSEASKSKAFSPEKNNYGYGWHVYDVLGRMQFSHGGYLPGWNSYVFFYPEDTLSVIVLSNIETANPLDICGNISRILYANQIDQPQKGLQTNLIGRYEMLGGAATPSEAPFESDIVTVNEMQGNIALKTSMGETIRFQKMGSDEWEDPKAQLRLQFKENSGRITLQVTKNGTIWRWQKLSGDFQTN